MLLALNSFIFKSMDQEHQKLVETSLSIVKQEIPDLIAVVLFGSFGSEYETKTSDLDLAVLSKQKMDSVILWQLAQKIAISVNRDIDLVDLSSSSTVFRFQILSTGNVIFCSDENAYAHFETTSFAMYYDFQESRKGILEDYEKGNLNYG